jgi:RNase adaptor protein for sRNA GlmZ degradation
MFDFRFADCITKHPFTLPDLQTPEQYKTANELQIRSYFEKDKKSEHFSKAIQKKIEQTLPNVERQGRRGDMKYNPEYSTLESR